MGWIDAYLKLLILASLNPDEQNPAYCDELLTAKELAEWLKVPVDYIYRQTRTGELPSIRMGRKLRYKRSQIIKWLENHAQNS